MTSIEAASPPPAPREPMAARVQVAPVSPPAPPPPTRADRVQRRSPAPRKRRSGASSREFVAFGSALLSFLLVFGVAALAVVQQGRAQYLAAGPLDAETVVMLPRGQGMDGIAEALVRNGVIRNADTFMWSVRALTLVGQRPELRPGEYRFPRGASMQQALGIIASGRVVQYRVSIPEGLTSWQIVQRLREMDFLAGELREMPSEGSLLPDTYYVERGTSRQRIVSNMADAQRRLLQEIWGRRRQDIPVRSPEELVTLASIVEKETSRAEERPRIAGVFVNRLNRRMRLQSDPTIIYGITEGRGVLGRAITRADIDRPTAYNTYTIAALPPTPIANPGREALEAVANPMRTNDLFFVADGTGAHTFSETYEAHQRAVARWREIERQRGGSVSPGLDVTQPQQQRPPQRPPAQPPRPQTQQGQPPVQGQTPPQQRTAQPQPLPLR